MELERDKGVRNMENIEINKTFDSLEECEAWEEENFPNRTYNGKMIFCIHHTEKAWNGKITINYITVL